MDILAICWGSSCRSPMAKAFLETELRKVGVDVAVKARALYEPADGVATRPSRDPPGKTGNHREGH